MSTCSISLTRLGESSESKITPLGNQTWATKVEVLYQELNILSPTDSEYRFHKAEIKNQDLNWGPPYWKPTVITTDWEPADQEYP